MIFNPETSALYSDDGEFLKTVHCPMGLRPEQLDDFMFGKEGVSGLPMPKAAGDRYCHSCEKTIRNIDNYTDEDMKEGLAVAEAYKFGGSRNSLCVFATPAAKNIVFLRRIGMRAPNFDEAPVVYTLRSLEAMDDAVRRGFNLIFKDAGKGDEGGIRKYIVFRHKETGRLWWSGDYRNECPWMDDEWAESLHASGHAECSTHLQDDWELVRTWFYARPDQPFPLAAYAIPPGLEIGARVYLDDLIEPNFQEMWNQGNAEVRIAAGATWYGSFLKVDPPEDCFVVG